MLTRHITQYARYAGEVLRWHCWPNTTPQTTGQHTWHVMRIYTEMFGLMAPDVSYYILHHDSGELNTGDLAHHVKAHNPELKKAMDTAERQGLEMIGIMLPLLTLREQLRIKACDLLEMAEYAVEEQLRGNQLMRPVTANIDWALYNHVEKMADSMYRDDVYVVRGAVVRMNDRT
jgi:5'-deoxynucleotidase YfbR-like HD superfamily hydrolase